MMNIQRQPTDTMSAVSNGGAMVGPSEEVQFQIPVGRPRPRTLYQSRTTRTAPENIGASPRPRNARVRTNCQKPATKPAVACATDQITRPAPSTRRGPSRSSSAPPGSWAKA